MKLNSKTIKATLMAVTLMFVGGGSAVAQNTFPNTGNVGVGIVSPQYLLDVNGTGQFSTVLSGDAKFGHYIANPNANAVVNVFGLHGSGSQSVFKVGVKTTDVDFRDIFLVKDDGTVIINKLFKNHPFIINSGTHEFFKVDENGKTIINAIQKSDNLSIKEYQTGNEVLVVNANGKLTVKAINNESHISVKHINGTEVFNVNKNGKTTIRAQANDDHLLIRHLNGSSLFSVGHDGNVILHAYGTQNPLSIYNGVHELFTFGHNGKIVVKDLQGHKILQLEDDGLLRAREIKVDQDNWPDYVFEKDYSILSLEQISKYILKHKHLPGVPSATQIKTEGLSLGKMQTILMQKVEELTLYTITQNTQIKDLEKNITQIEKENNQLKSDLQQMNDRLVKIEAMLNHK
jgi:hypothetical protein